MSKSDEELSPRDIEYGQLGKKKAKKSNIFLNSKLWIEIEEKCKIIHNMVSLG